MRYIEQKMTNPEMKNLYQNNKVIIWGAGHQGRMLSKLLLGYGIDVVAICDKNPELQGQYYDKVPVISYSELCDMTKENQNILVKIAVESGLHPKAEEEIAVDLQKINVKNYLPFAPLEMVRKDLKSANIEFVGSGEKNKIRVTKIDEQLSIYRDNKVILYLNGSDGEIDKSIGDLLQVFKYHKIGIDAICGNFKGGGGGLMIHLFKIFR